MRTCPVVTVRATVQQVLRYSKDDPNGPANSPANSPDRSGILDSPDYSPRTPVEDPDNKDWQSEYMKFTCQSTVPSPDSTKDSEKKQPEGSPADEDSDSGSYGEEEKEKDSPVDGMSVDAEKEKPFSPGSGQLSEGVQALVRKIYSDPESSKWLTKVKGKPDYTFSDLDDDSEKKSTSEGDSSSSSSEEENPKKRKWYHAKPEYVINDGTWVEMEQSFDCHQAPVSVRYSIDGSSYFCMKRSFYNEKFNDGDWAVGMRLALKEQPGVGYCFAKHGCGVVRMPVRHGYRAISFLCQKEEFVFAHVSKQWGKVIKLAPGMNTISWCFAELGFTWTGAYDLLDNDDPAQDGLSFAAAMGTRWVPVRGGNASGTDELVAHSYTYLYDMFVHPPVVLMVCDDEGTVSAQQLERAQRFAQKKDIYSARREEDWADDWKEVMTGELFMRLYLKPVLRAGRACQHGFLFT
jgi:hypothetical protein